MDNIILLTLWLIFCSIFLFIFNKLSYNKEDNKEDNTKEKLDEFNEIKRLINRAVENRTNGKYLDPVKTRHELEGIRYDALVFLDKIMREEQASYNKNRSFRY